MFTGLASPTHLLLLLLLIVLLFGIKRLPEIGRNLGRGIQEFSDGVSSTEETKKKVKRKRAKAIEKEEEPQRTLIEGPAAPWLLDKVFERHPLYRLFKRL